MELCPLLLLRITIFIRKLVQILDIIFRNIIIIITIMIIIMMIMIISTVIIIAITIILVIIPIGLSTIITKLLFICKVYINPD